MSYGLLPINRMGDVNIVPSLIEPCFRIGILSLVQRIVNGKFHLIIPFVGNGSALIAEMGCFQAYYSTQTAGAQEPPSELSEVREKKNKSSRVLTIPMESVIMQCRLFSPRLIATDG